MLFLGAIKGGGFCVGGVIGLSGRFVGAMWLEEQWDCRSNKEENLRMAEVSGGQGCLLVFRVGA